MLYVFPDLYNVDECVTSTWLLIICELYLSCLAMVSYIKNTLRPLADRVSFSFQRLPHHCLLLKILFSTFSFSKDYFVTIIQERVLRL